jgi:uncharacterized membrane-anchored protein
MKIRIIISTVFTLVVLSVLFGIVVQKERLLVHGHRVFFKLAPRDPRSLMQGDYMALRYDLAEEINTIREGKNIKSRSGSAVITLNEKGVAISVRIGSGDMPIGSAERLIRYKFLKDNISFGAESFFFEEGQGSAYEKARYGELVLDDTGSSILIGLRDENLKVLHAK